MAVVGATRPARHAGWSAPTTLVWGEDDRVTPVENARALAVPHA
jgi:pimeloyl-ACP methyl ester carboxylesterase